LICFVFSLMSINNMTSQNSDNEQNKGKMANTSETDWTKDKRNVMSLSKKYAQAWCSQKPENVASFYAKEGSLTINNGKPSIGRYAITQCAKAFMDAFPDDMIVAFDKLVKTPNGIEFHWTLTGTNTGPNGTGKKVNISGFEHWKLDDDGLIKQSKGTFDEVDYAMQLNQGLRD